MEDVGIEINNLLPMMKILPVETICKVGLLKNMNMLS